MDPIVTGALISGGASLIGGWMSNNASARSAEAQMAFQSAQAQAQRRWAAGQSEIARNFDSRSATRMMRFQDRMSSSAHTREVRDLRRAGLNPILSGTGGMGSASAAGAAAHAQVPSSSAPHGAQYTARNYFGEGVATALEALRAVSLVKSQEQDRSIKKPVESVADVATKGVEAVKDVVKPIAEGVASVVQTIERKVQDGSLSSAVAERVEKVVEGAKEIAKDVAGKLAVPAKVISESASSAWQGYKDLIHGKRGVEPPPSKGKIPREAQERFRRYEWKFNYRP